MEKNRQVNARLPEKLREYVTLRAKECELPVGAYLSQIALWWFEQGAPPVHEYEARLLIERHAVKKAVFHPQPLESRPLVPETGRTEC